MDSPCEAQALIRGDSIVSSGNARRDAVLLLQEPSVNHDPTDQRTSASTDMWNCRYARHLSGENVRQVGPGDAKVAGSGFDIHDFPITEYLG
jgi:hypothetical protein